MRAVIGLLASVCIVSACAKRESPAAEGDGFASRRAAMVAHQIGARGVSDPGVLDAMRSVPRHLFVPESEVPYAYDDHPLPIGLGQTISQPFMVAAMSELAQVRPGDTVLEVGTGSGYQAAVLDCMGARVFTIEIVEELARTAAERLARLGYTNTTVRAGDGYAGWPEHAPFDAVLVTAGATHVPQPLVDQMKPGAKMVIPVGPTLDVQSLKVLTKRADGGVDEQDVMPVRFVPLTGEGQRRSE